MRKYHDLIESIKTLMEDSPPIAKGGQTIGKPAWSPTQNKPGKTQPFSLSGKIKPNKDSQEHINHFASVIGRNTTNNIGMVSSVFKNFPEHKEYAQHVHNAATKFKNDDDAARHLHENSPTFRPLSGMHKIRPGQEPKTAIPYDKLSDSQKNHYKQHIKHMREIIGGERFKQLPVK